MSLDYVATGSLGVFWRYDGSHLPAGDEAERGWLSSSGPEIHVDVIDERDIEEQWEHDGEDALTAGSSLLGSLEEDGVLLTECWPRGDRQRFGGARISTRHYAARTLIGNVSPGDLRSDKLLLLRANFESLTRWADQSVVTERLHWDDRKVAGFTIEGTRGRERSARIDRRRKLTIEPRWSIGRADRRRRSIAVPISIGCVATSRASTFELFRPLYDVQNLIGVLHSGFVAADSCDALVDLRPGLPDIERGICPAWNGPLMVQPKQVSQPPQNDLPLASLAEIGGIRALARWVKLCAAHPRACDVATLPVRSGPLRPEVDVVTIGATLEYWVAAHKADGWTRKPPGSPRGWSFTHSAAAHAGSAFDSWTGGAAVWATEFRELYNGLKHDPALVVDSRRLTDLAASSRLLLLALLLNEIAGRSKPSEALLAHHRYRSLGERIRQWPISATKPIGSKR